MKMYSGNFYSKSIISLEDMDLTTAARQISRLGSCPHEVLGRLVPDDLLDNDLCSAPLPNAAGLNDLLSGDLSSLAS